jgi:hypothetical protein
MISRRQEIARFRASFAPVGGRHAGRLTPAPGCYLEVALLPLDVPRARLPVPLPSLTEAPQSRFHPELARGAHENLVS